METHLDKFQILNYLGRGVFGQVFLCIDPFLARKCAVKIIEVEEPDKFVAAITEARILDFCRHKYVVDIREVRTTLFNQKPMVLIAMEYLPNGSIQKLIESRFVSVKETCRFIQQSLLGLENAHNNGVIHRDIKPGNILLNDNYEAKLSDFGLAINYHLNPSDLAGYYPHQPLEVILGNPMDKLSDIYAMGITFYRLLNRIDNLSVPFSDEQKTIIDKERLIKELKSDSFPIRQFRPHIPNKIIKILKKAIHKNKDNRYQSCIEFRQALERLQFFVDWIPVDTNTWIGKNNGDNFSLSKINKRSGWNIEFRRNGIRQSKHCLDNLKEEEVDKKFFQIIQNTNLD